MSITGCSLRGREKGSEVIPEDVGVGIVLVEVTANARVTGAKIALRIVGRPSLCDRFDLSLPGAGGTMRGDEKPLAGERIPSAVRAFHEIHNVKKV